MADKYDKLVEMFTGVKQNMDNLVKASKDNAKNKIQKVTANFKGFLVFGLYVWCVYWIIRNVGIFKIAPIERAIFLILQQFSFEPDTLLLGFLHIDIAIAWISGLILILLYFDIYGLILWEFVSGKENPLKTALEAITNFQLAKIIGPVFATFVILLVITDFFALGDVNTEGLNAQEKVESRVDEFFETYTGCLIKESLNGNPTICKDLQKQKELEASQKTKYQIKIDELKYQTYDLSKNPNVEIQYSILTQGGEIEIIKFECYKTKKDDMKENLLDSQEFENKIIKSTISEYRERFTCNLGELNFTESNNRFKIVPVLYYRINSRITQEIPIQTIPVEKTDYLYNDKYEAILEQYKNVNLATISNQVINVKEMWYPYSPIITNPPFETEFQITYKMKRNSIESMSDFGQIIKSEITNIKVPERLEYSCGSNKGECLGPLFTEELGTNTQSILDLNLKLIQIPEEMVTASYMELEMTSEMELKKSKTINFINPYYEENMAKKESENSNENQIIPEETSWIEIENGLNIIKTDYERKKTLYPDVEKDCQALLDLINECFEISSEGKIIDEKTEKTSYDLSRNLELKNSYSNLKSMIDSDRIKIDSEIEKITETTKQDLMNEYAGP